MSKSGNPTPSPREPERKYSGVPPFFTPDGSAVTREYVMHLRTLLRVPIGVSLHEAIAKQESALDALAEAVKPLQHEITTADEWQDRYGESPRKSYAVDASAIKPLLSAITQLLAGRGTR